MDIFRNFLEHLTHPYYTYIFLFTPKVIKLNLDGLIIFPILLRMIVNDVEHYHNNIMSFLKLREKMSYIHLVKPNHISIFVFLEWCYCTLLKIFLISSYLCISVDNVIKYYYFIIVRKILKFNIKKIGCICNLHPYKFYLKHNCVFYLLTKIIKIKCIFNKTT